MQAGFNLFSAGGTCKFVRKWVIYPKVETARNTMRPWFSVALLLALKKGKQLKT